MAHLKSNVKLAADNSDATVADLITDGCNMGVKTLNKYINQYKHADSAAVSLAKKVIRCEEKLCSDVKRYL